MAKKQLLGILAIALCLSLFLTLNAFSAAAAQVTDDGISYHMFGDVNDDGVIDVRDLVRMKRNISNSEVELCQCAADINADDAIDALDVSRFVKCLLGVDDVLEDGGNLWSPIY